MIGLDDENVFPSKNPGQEEAFPRQLKEEEKCIPFRRKSSMDSIIAYGIHERSSICSQIIAFTPSCWSKNLKTEQNTVYSRDD